MDKEKALRRIQKCLALAASSEPNEAAAALRQAQLLMDKYDIDAVDAKLADILESEIKSSGKRHIAQWEANLACTVADALACKVMHRRGACQGEVRVRPFLSNKREHYRATYSNGSIVFLGQGPRAEIARYAFETLRRQLRKARKEFSDRYEVDAKKIDAFAQGWVMAISAKVGAIAPADELARIDEAMHRRHKPVGVAETKDLAGLSNCDSTTLRAASMGLQAGREVDLYSGVNNVARVQLTSARPMETN